MALSEGDVDEAVLFAKVTVNLWLPQCDSSLALKSSFCFVIGFI